AAPGFHSRAGRAHEGCEGQARQRRPVLRPIQASAEDLAQQRVKLPYATLDAVLIKEAIHHVVDPAPVVSGLADLPTPCGRLLVVMLPTTIEYPLFDAALERYEALQPDPAAIAERMRTAGLHGQCGAG